MASAKAPPRRRRPAPKAAVLLAVLLAAWALGVLAEPPPPRLVTERDVLLLVDLPPVLGDEEVKRQLATGLTTTFIFRAAGRDAAGRPLEGAARVEIRYEPWDEVYFLSALGRDGSLVRDTLDSPAALAERWHGLRLALTRPPARRSAGSLRLELDVIPFSRGEQRDTQRWFSESMDQGATAEQTSRASEDRAETLEEVFNLLLATSIQRRAILSYSWQVAPSRSSP